MERKKNKTENYLVQPGFLELSNLQLHLSLLDLLLKLFQAHDTPKGERPRETTLEGAENYLQMFSSVSLCLGCAITLFVCYGSHSREHMENCL